MVASRLASPPSSSSRAAGVAAGVLRRGLVASRLDVKHRLVRDRDVLDDRLDPAAREEVTDFMRHVRPADEAREIRRRDPRDGGFGGRANRRIGVGRKEDEEAELLVGPRRERALRRHHADVRRDLSPPEAVKKRRAIERLHEGLAEKALEAGGGNRPCHDFSGGAESAGRPAIERHRQDAGVAGRQRDRLLDGELDPLAGCSRPRRRARAVDAHRDPARVVERQQDHQRRQSRRTGPGRCRRPGGLRGARAPRARAARPRTRQPDRPPLNGSPEARPPEPPRSPQAERARSRAPGTSGVLAEAPNSPRPQAPALAAGPAAGAPVPKRE